MRRITAAAVAAATAVSLATAPAFAEDAPAQPPTENTGTENPGEDAPAPKPDEDAPAPKPDEDEGSPAPQKKSDHAIGVATGTITGIVAAIATTAMIVFSSPDGVNKIIRLLNANGFNLPAWNVPKISF